MILVVAAVAAELRHLHPRPSVEILACGVGPVEAAVATSRSLAAAKPTLVINAGIGGAFAGRATVGDAYAIANCFFADLGLEDGSPMPPLPGGIILETVAAADARMLAAARASNIAIADGLTVATITTSHARAGILAARFPSAVVEAMEGFAVLRAANAAGLPAIEVRGISNIVGPRSEANWNFDLGARALARALDDLLDALDDPS